MHVELTLEVCSGNAYISSVCHLEALVMVDAAYVAVMHVQANLVCRNKLTAQTETRHK